MARERPIVPRPYGECYTKSVRVRLTPELDAAIREARQLFHISSSQLIRWGIMHSMGQFVSNAISVIHDPATTDEFKIRVMAFVRTIQEAELSQHNPKMIAELRAYKERVRVNTWRATRERNKTKNQAQIKKRAAHKQSPSTRVVNLPDIDLEAMQECTKLVASLDL